MALVSPGIEITVQDDSQYAPNNASTVPLLIVASTQDKINSGGTIAAGTTAANADSLFVLTSQRDVLTTYGSPAFYTNTSSSPIHGYELNEYGLLTAYSLLGVTNKCYVIRADIDLGELISLGDRPLAAPDDATYWLDIIPTRLGMFEWDAVDQEFVPILPLVITDTDDLSGGLPKNSIGQRGQYAVVTTNTANPVYYKNSANDWVLVGSQDWMISWAAIQGSETNPLLSINESVEINGEIVTLTGTTVASLATDINNAGIAGVTAAAVDGKLELYADDTASSTGSAIDGAIAISNDSGTPLTDLGIEATTYYRPAVQLSKHTSVPTWKSGDDAPRPTGSIWVKTTASNYGASFAVKRYNSLTQSWQLLSAPLYSTDADANKGYDPLRGGSGIPIGSVYVQYDVSNNSTVTYKVLNRVKTGVTFVTGDDTTPTFTSGNRFTIKYSVPNSDSMSAASTVILSGTTAATFVEDILALGLTYVSAQVNANGSISIIHTAGGVLELKNVSGQGTPLAAAGIAATNDYCRLGPDSQIIVSNWVATTYTASTNSPGQDPADKTKWYWGELGEADVMIHNGTVWKGYRNVANDARGFNLTNTDPNGPIFSVVEPTEQSDGTQLVYGDLWIDTSDLEAYPLIRRWSLINSEDKWVQLDNTDQTSENGILFADARFMGSSTLDTVNDTIPAISELLINDYVDLDAPEPLSYPRGMILFNTRRSSFNVKEYRKNYFNSTDFAGDTLPTETNAWVSISGSRENGHSYFGRRAQRNVVVTAMKKAIDTNTEIREEQREFNLIAAPGYPELIPNMVQLNNDRKNTAFVVGDSPFRIPTEGTALTNWLTNIELASVESEDALVTRDPYLGVFYPSVLGADLSGNSVALPASYGVLRMIHRSDNAAAQWFAPAGVRRGGLDNVNRIGYLTSTGEFYAVGVRQGVRDILYENSVNPLTYSPTTGIINDGNKTRSSSSSALDRINVSRLIAFMRTQLDKIVRPFLFEPNDKTTRDEVKGVIDRFCNDLITKRALYDYLVVCDETNNTPTRIDANELHIDIAIEPVKAIEFIYIPIRIKNTGEIASGNISSSRTV
jgi:hypothetical protein